MTRAKFRELDHLPSMRRRSRGGRWVALGALAALAYVVASPADGERQERTTTPPVKNFQIVTPGTSKPAPIDSGVFRPYDHANFPKTFARYGERIVTGTLQMMRERVAHHAASQPGCGSVEYAELSDNESGPNGLVVFADCSNGMRFYQDAEGKVWSRKVF